MGKLKKEDTKDIDRDHGKDNIDPATRGKQGDDDLGKDTDSGDVNIDALEHQLENPGTLSNLVNATHDNDGTDLFLLGIPSAYHDKRPTEFTFPTMFNHKAKHIWAEIFEDKIIISLLRTKTVQDQWEFVINEFKARTKVADVDYNSGKKHVNNMLIAGMLLKTRRTLVRHFKKLDILKFFKMPNRTKRRIIKNDSGATIYVASKVLPNISNVDIIMQLHRKGFFLKEGKYVYKVSSNTTIFYDVFNHIIGYSFDLKGHPQVGKSCYFKVIENMLLTAIRQNRIKDIPHMRLF